MAYIGKTPSQATRSRFYYTATGGETSLSGADDNGNTLIFSDGNYVDVMLNGVTLVAGTDYDTDTANTIDNLTALTASDIVEIVVYDTFSVFSGNVNSNFSVGGNMSVTGTTNTGLVLPTTDDSSDLGSSTKRYQDIYTSGGIFLGGTGAANYLDNYEEGTFTPTFNGSVSDPTVTYDAQVGEYVRIGNIVHVVINLGSDAVSGGSGDLLIAGLPFAASSSSGGGLSWNRCYAYASNPGTSIYMGLGNSSMKFWPHNDITETTVAALGTGVNDNRTTISGTYMVD